MMIKKIIGQSFKHMFIKIKIIITKATKCTNFTYHYVYIKLSIYLLCYSVTYYVNHKIYLILCIVSIYN